MRFEVPRRQNGSAMGLGLAGAALGAALVYWLDPQSGPRRRGEVRQKARHAAVEARWAVGVSARDLAHRSEGFVARLRNRLADAGARIRGEAPDDDVLVARVRARLGRLCSHPSAIEVHSRDGRVALRGPILAAEADAVLRGIAKVSGARGIDDDLERHETAGNVPGLQGGAGVRVERPELLQENWSPATRTLAGTAGVALLTWGAALRSVTGAGAGLVGAGLLLRSVTNLPTTRLVGIGAGRRAIDFQKELYVGAPVEEVFGFFNRFENFPKIMSHVREVVPLGADGRRWRWSVSGPAGLTVSWDAEVTQYERNRVIAWKSLGSMIRNAGIVRFEPEGNGTCLRIRLSYNPPGGAMGHAVVTALGANPKQQLDQDLITFKSFIEAERTEPARPS